MRREIHDTALAREQVMLKVGERVILLRADGGQQYVILDRVEAPKT